MSKRPTVILCKTARTPPDLPAALTSLEGRAALTEAAAALCAAPRDMRVVEQGRCRRACSSAALAATATAAHAAAAAAAATRQVSGGARALGSFRVVVAFCLFSCGLVVWRCVCGAI